MKRLERLVNTFEISLNRPRFFGGYEAITASEDHRTWRKIADAFSKISLSPPSVGPVHIEIDWSSAVEYCRLREEFYSKPQPGLAQILENPPSFFKYNITCPALVTFGRRQEHLEIWRGRDVLHHLLLNLFLIANIATPGSMNFYQSKIRATGAASESDPLAVIDLKLSQYIFEDSWHEAQRSSWAKVGFLDFDAVMEWHRGLEIGFSLVARTKMQKVWFSMLHLTRASIDSPEATIWIASTLEDLFDTRTGSSFQQLTRRLSSMLGLTEKDSSIVKKNLRGFFDRRHGFAHGGSPIFHLIRNEFWDKQVEDIYDEFQLPNGMAATLLLGVVQEIVRRNLKDFRYDESLVLVI